MKFRLFYKRYYYFFIIMLTLISCKNDKAAIEGFKEKDLLSAGVPLKIQAPEDVKVDINVENFYKDITVKNDKDYFIQITSTELITTDIQSLMNELKAEAKKNPFFTKFILEKESGFVFEKKTQDGKLTYDFRYVKLDENQQFIFQGGRYRVFTKDQALKMFKSVKQ